MNYQEILDKYVGKPVEAEDPSNKYQCMDWAFKWCDEINIDRSTIRHLYAYQAFTQPNDLTLEKFDYIPNTPNGIPQLGDVVIFSTGVGIAGHIAVVQSADKDKVRSLDQNWSGHSYCEYITHPYDNILGWLHPKSAIITQPITQEITLQTNIPQIDGMEVQAIRSELLDSRETIASNKSTIQKLQLDLDSLRDHISTLEMPLKPVPSEPFVASTTVSSSTPKSSFINSLLSFFGF